MSEFPSAWVHRMSALAASFSLDFQHLGTHIELRGSDLLLRIRAAGPVDLPWAVFAVRLLSQPDGSGLETAMQFAVFNHHLMHVHDLPIILAMDPKTGDWEVLVQVSLDGLSETELPQFVSLYLHTVQGLIFQIAQPQDAETDFHQ